MWLGKGNYKDFLFARKRLGAVAPLPWVAEMAEFSRNLFFGSYLLRLFWNYLGIGLSIALLALAESPAANQEWHIAIKFLKRFGKSLPNFHLTISGRFRTSERSDAQPPSAGYSTIPLPPLP